MSFLCASNPLGNYQNPFNCTQFVMCGPDGSVFLWQCPGPGSYDPVPVYQGSPSDQCPWRSLWYSEDPINCSTIGQRLFWSPFTIPVDPKAHCGEEIRRCLKYEEIDSGRCPEGEGYSKGYNACLPKDICLAVDSFLDLFR